MAAAARVLAERSAETTMLVANTLALVETASNDLARAAENAVVAIDAADAASAGGYARHLVAAANAAADDVADGARDELRALARLTHDAAARAVLAEKRATGVKLALADIANRARRTLASAEGIVRDAAEERARRARRAPAPPAPRRMEIGGVRKRRRPLSEAQKLHDDLRSVLERDGAMRAWMGSGSGGSRRARRGRSARDMWQ